MRLPRCMQIFNQSIKSEQTRIAYTKGLNRFLKMTKISSPEKLLKMTQKDTQILVEDYVFSLKTQVNPSTVETYLTGVKLFFVMNDVILNWAKIKKFLPERPKRLGSKAYTTEDVRSIISKSPNPRYKAMILFMASSGVRVGSLHEMQMKHLTNMPHDCKSILVYPKTKDEYTTFISNEASLALEEYHNERIRQGDTITDDSFLFTNGKNWDFKKMSNESVTITLKYHISKIHRTKESENRYEKQTNHAFRKRFNTILKSNESVNISLAERLMGHSQTVSLDNSYFDPSLENLFKEYLKVLPDLLVDERYTLTSENIQKQQRIEELESKNVKIELLESQMREMQAHLKNINNQP